MTEGHDPGSPVAYVSLYRKYRPQTFEDLVGQKHVARTLTNAINQGRVAHAYLFCGPRGTGKTTTARLLAKALNCAQGPTSTPDDTCETCRAIASGSALDVVEMDAASNRGIDEIRALRERIHFAPTEGRYKVYIVDEVHMLTPEAFNALLKVLEEPPEHTVFVLCTTEPHKVPATIASRCQRFDFRRISVTDVVARLERIAGLEGIEVERTGLYEIALAAQGSLRDAISTLDQLAAFTEKRVGADDVAGLLGTAHQDLLFDATDHVARGDAAGALRFIDEAVQSGQDPAAVIRGLLGHFRGIYVTKVAGDAPGVLDVAPEVHQRLVAQSREFGERALEHALHTLSAAQSELRTGWDARLLLEVTMVRLARPVEGVDEIADRVEELERKVRRHPDVSASAGAGRRPPVRTRTTRTSEDGRPSMLVEPPEPTGRSGTGEAAGDKESGEPIPAEEATPAEEVHVPDGAAPHERDAPETSEGSDTRETPAASARGEEPSTEAIQRYWDLFLSALGNPAVSGPLKDAEPAVLDGVLVISVGDSAREQRFSTPEKLAALGKAAEQVFGKPIGVRVVVGGRPAEREARQQDPGHYHAKLKHKFDAEHVHEIRAGDQAMED